MNSAQPLSLPRPIPNISRRAFLQRCGQLAALTGLPGWFIERQQLRAAENFLRLGLNNRFGSV